MAAVPQCVGDGLSGPLRTEGGALNGQNASSCMVTCAPAGTACLKADVLGLLANTVVGLASAGPAYSLAATLSLLVVAVGVRAPAVVLLASVPTLLIALACRHLNRVQPDCGTTFAWSATAFGAYIGWIGGWALLTTDVIVMANMAQIGGQYVYTLAGAQEMSQSAVTTTAVGIAWIGATTWLCYLGVELSVRAQLTMLSVELGVLVVFAAGALLRVYGDPGLEHAIRPAFVWFDPSAVSLSALAKGMLLAIFIYWGWDTALAVNEESIDQRRTPGRAALLAMVLLLAAYLLVTVAALAFAGVGEERGGLRDPVNAQDSLLSVGRRVFSGGLWMKVLALAVLSSAVASMQTTVLAATRLMLSMARAGALPRALGHIHPRFQTPTVATAVTGALSAAYFAGMNLFAADLLADSIASLGLMIAFYYALTAFACAWHVAAEAHDVQAFLRSGALPLAGGIMLTAVLVAAACDAAVAGNGKTSYAGVGGALWLGAGTLALGTLISVLYGLSANDYFCGITLPRQRRGTSIRAASRPRLSGGATEG